MTHTPKSVLRNLGPCAGGYHWALHFKTLEDAYPTCPADNLLWYFFAATVKHQAKKALLVSPFTDLVNAMLKDVPASQQAQTTMLLTNLAAFAKDTTKCPIVPGPYTGNNSTVRIAYNVLTVLINFIQPTTKHGHVGKLIGELLMILPAFYNTPATLKQYFTLTLVTAVIPS
jgi:hypothetical protein